MSTPDDLLPIAQTVAREAGEFIISMRDKAEVTATKSSEVDIVTQVDVASERLIRQRLSELRPDDGVVGEEGESSSGTSGITWIIDPIDGTVNYLYGIDQFAVSVAAVSGVPASSSWQLEAGAVYDGSSTLWSAARGRGARRNDAVLKVGVRPALSGALVATGFQYESHRRAVQGAIVAELLPQVRDIRRFGSAAVDLCFSAAGVIDAYYEQGLHAWDFAAGALIAQEAGMMVAGYDGERADERLVIAAHPERWDELHTALRRAGMAPTWELATP
ncbi:inositol monophosphatase family protein [Demequina sediminicola]|uniref:inositol monophosphatase family protein n=1 Tax=Demequina sediminicola TaxID=1095026 RepID=UPI000783A81E|nr:inositol monophosphatase family protein [Demequina sediminicola]